MANNIWELIPTDVLVEVLLRLPPSARRRSRLVCRHWRDDVDTHTNEMRSRPKTLVATRESLYLIEDDDGGATATVRLWSGHTYLGRASLIGTCNGLVCLCDNTRPGGAIALANPLTGARLPIPPPPLAYSAVSPYWRRTYCFAYHPRTGRYKVVHIHSDLTRTRVWVFTLGERSWRHVPNVYTASGPRAMFNPEPGIVAVDGAVYWAAQARGGTPLIMALDLDDERVASIPISTLPLSNSNPGCCWKLLDARGRLGVVVAGSSLGGTEVWVMEGATTGGWSRRYMVRIHEQPPPPSLFSHYLHDHYLTWPMLFSHDGEHILTMRRCRGAVSRFVFYKHKIIGDGSTKNKAQRGVAEIHERIHGTVVANIETNYYLCRTFAYVETTEPLSVYKCW